MQLREFTIRPELNEIEAEGRVTRVESRSMQVLMVFARHPGEILSKEELLHQVWGEAFVTDEVLTRAVWELRRAFGDDARNPTFISTVPRKGYRLLIAPQPSARHEQPADEEPETPIAEILASPEVVPTRAEISPTAKRRGSFLLALVFLGTTAWWAGFRLGPKTEIPVATTRSEMPPAKVAVTRFENTAGDAALQSFETGLAILIANGLGESSEFRILAAESVFAAENRHQSDRQGHELASFLGHELDADLVVRGYLFRAGQRVRVDVQVRRPGEQEMLTSVSLTAARPDDLLDVVNDLCLRLRRALGDDAPAMIAFATTRSPAALDFYARGVNVQVERGLAAALDLYSQAVEEDPGFAMAHLKLAIGYSRQGWDSQARHHAQQASQHADRLPNRERLYIQGSAASFRESTHAESIESFSAAVRAFPDHAAARHNLGVIFMELDNFDEAARVFEDNVQRHPDLIFGAKLLAVAQAAKGREEDARRAALDWTTKAPEDPRAHASLAMLEILLNRLDEAHAAKQRTESLGGSDRLLTWILHILDEDWQIVDRALLSPSRASGVIEQADEARLRAMAQLYRGRPRAALEEIDRVVGHGTAGSRVLTELLSLAASLERELGRHDAALARARSAIAEGSGDRAEWLGLAELVLTQAEIGDFPAAAGHVAELEEKTSGLPTLREACRVEWLKGRLALLQQEPQKAIRHLQRAVDLLPPRATFWEGSWTPLHPPVWYDLGRAHLAAGDEDQALSWFKRLTESGAERLTWPLPYVRSLDYLAVIHEERGEQEEALRAYEKYLALWQEGETDPARVARAQKKLSRLPGNSPTLSVR